MSVHFFRFCKSQTAQTVCLAPVIPATECCLVETVAAAETSPAPMATPTSAAARAMRSLTPSPQYMHVLPSPCRWIRRHAVCFWHDTSAQEFTACMTWCYTFLAIVTAVKVIAMAAVGVYTVALVSAWPRGNAASDVLTNMCLSLLM